MVDMTYPDALAPLADLLEDPDVVEIMIDNHETIYVERQGKFKDVSSPFQNEGELLQMMKALATSAGRKLDDTHPLADIRAGDQLRANMILPPISKRGPAMVIRKLAVGLLTFDDLIEFGSISQPIIEFLKACMRGRLNMIMAGGTGSGKTTLLNMISEWIPSEERVIMVENASEIQPPSNLRRLVRLESRPPAKGIEPITMEELVSNALRMRPDRLIIGEVRGGEVMSAIEAINTGHDGTLLNLHSTGPGDTLTRLETMIVMANPSFPLLNVRQQMAVAFDLIVYVERLSDGSRKVTHVSDVVGMQGEVILLQDIFKFQQTGREEGKIEGEFLATGTIPSFMKRLHSSGVDLPVTLFTPR